MVGPIGNGGQDPRNMTGLGIFVGKGSKRRPRSVSRAQEEENWARTFGKKPKEEEDKEKTPCPCEEEKE